jgi:hypothetical protein
MLGDDINLVHAPVYLEDQSRAVADEIDDVGAYRSLATKTEPLQPPQLLPQLPFGKCRLVAKLAGSAICPLA